MKQISTASGKAAWSLASKVGEPMQPAFFRYNDKLIAHSGDTYIEGVKPGDYGFCTDAARSAYDQGGVWLDHVSTSAAASLGRKGGAAKTPVKQAASRDNGKKGGRPKKNHTKK
jgi:hypothetical protein